MSTADNRHKLRTAITFHQAGRLESAAKIYRQILESEPDNFQALHCFGLVEASAGHLQRAKSLVGRALEIQPADVQVVENYATILFQLQEFEEALQVSRRGLQISPNSASCLYAGAIALYKLRRLDESIGQFDKLLAVAPSHIAAINERGSVLAEMKKYDAALASFHKVLSLEPRYVGAHLNIGNVYGLLRRYDEAIAAYGDALTLQPDLADAWLGCGNVYVRRKRYNDALVAFDKAVAIKPDLAAAWLGRGNVYAELRRYGDALPAFNKAFTLKPGDPFAEGARLHAKMRLCDWSKLEAERVHLEASIRTGVPTSPFAVLAVSASAQIQQECANVFCSAEYPGAGAPLWRGDRYNHQRIRLAYLSADFGEHPVSFLMAGVFEWHSRERFEAVALSYRPPDHSDLSTRLRDSFDQFIDVQERSDAEVSNLVRDLEIDIAVDLMGHTSNSRTAILAHRPAPVQINYLGYPGTMGADYIDYIIGDPWVISEEQRQFYTEKVIWLPNTFQANDSERKISEVCPSRAAAGLPENAFVFCVFNNSYKITPAVFDVWMRLLQRTPGSVLWLLADNPTVEGNLRREAEGRGVDAGRLIFAPRIPYADYLARYRLADLCLDTQPFNAGTTASDALWAGLPLITCAGEAFAARMASSLLRAVGMPELVTGSMADYEALAAELASDPGLMASTRAKLAHNRLSKPLFDTALFTRHLEAAYMAAHERAQAGLPPDHIVVPQ
jgi:predicted O-linked N-acetylglucosamine transferase (SPINDLY family)